ncbi:IMP cyclohydrolase [Kribbella sp. NPDC050124]|uniref:IMP cyclohydrolase n=1 Tax=Kribbella sp. NPDC050124 TaxID=3364114 RepID=UPI003792CF82
MRSLEDAAGAVEYPGRGLVVGRDEDGLPFVAYWLTGRSRASKRRRLVVGDWEIVVEDVSGGPRDELRHYTAAVRTADWVVVGNGTQVSDLAAARRSRTDLQLALREHAYEPDPPIRTPRIFASASTDGTGVVVGSARAVPGAVDLVQHPSLYLAQLPLATAVTVKTYGGSTSAVVADGLPEIVSCKDSWRSVAGLWDVLDPSIRVGLFVVPLNAPNFERAVLAF